MKFKNEAERVFWGQVFAALVATGSSFDGAASLADKALVPFRERYEPPTTPNLGPL